VLDHSTLVLEGVTLGLTVESVVEVLVDLALLPVLGKHTAQNPLAAHPEDLDGHTGVGSTLTLTVTGVATSRASLVEGPSAALGGANDGLGNDQAVRHELADLLTRVGKTNLRGLVGVKPDLVLAHAENVGRKTLLESEVRHFRLMKSWKRKEVLKRAEEDTLTAQPLTHRAVTAQSPAIESPNARTHTAVTTGAHRPHTTRDHILSNQEITP